MKDQRGLTLIELLAVIVILGIIAAIAIPAIGGLIDNTKKDAHIANAQQMANAARLYVVDEKVDLTSAHTVTLGTLVSKGYLENIKDPSDKTKNYGDASQVVITKATGKTTYTVTLQSSDITPKVYITSKNAETVARGDVTL